MHKVTLTFPSLLLLVDYLFVNKDCKAKIDHDKLTLKGTFSTADIELALNGYEATVVIEKSKGNKKGL